MTRLPRLLASSVIRGATLGESHGGLYLVDLERRTAALKLDWNRTDIDIAGRGGDRGLRGIAFHRESILVAANASLLVLDQDFRVLDAYTNPYLMHCHEISVIDDQVFLTATGCDSVLAFDLSRKRFIRGMHFGIQGNALTLSHFDPATRTGPRPGHQLHLNSVTASRQRLWIGGLHTPGLLTTDGTSLGVAAPLPPGTHNARPWRAGVLYNDTAADRVCHATPSGPVSLAVPRFERSAILHADRFESAVARAGFARGLCVLGNGLVAGGSSPSTIALYDVDAARRVMEFNLSMDIRNAIHGLAEWPYA